jgi:hypothetical protein
MYQRRRFFIFAAGLAVPLLGRSANAQLGGLTGLLGGGGGGGVDPGAFTHHITVGTMAFMRSSVAMNQAIGRADQASRLQAFVDSTRGADMTSGSFKQAKELLSEAEIPSGAQIRANKAEAGKLVGAAWVFATLAGYVDKLAVDDARSMTNVHSPDPRVLAILPMAMSAVTALPAHIQGAVTIISKTTSYMASNGLQRVNGSEANRMVTTAMPNSADLIKNVKWS